MEGPVVIIGWIIVLVIARFILLWYWRINEALELLKSIDRNLERLLVAGSNQPTGEPGPRSTIP